MAEKDVDEQFAAIMAHWQDEALGRDPYGDPDPSDPSAPSAMSAEEHAEPAPDARTDAEPAPRDLPEILRIRDVTDLPDVDDPSLRTVDVPVVRPSERDTSDHVDAADGVDAEAHVEADVEADEEHYTPPPPAPLPPSEDKHFWVMVGALVAGPLMFLYLLLFNRDGNGWWMLFALLVSISGFVLLVLRQPLERDEDDDGIRL